jgi:hypothetical protein
VGRNFCTPLLGGAPLASRGSVQCLLADCSQFPWGMRCDSFVASFHGYHVHQKSHSLVNDQITRFLILGVVNTLPRPENSVPKEEKRTHITPSCCSMLMLMSLSKGVVQRGCPKGLITVESCRGLPKVVVQLVADVVDVQRVCHRCLLLVPAGFDVDVTDGC